MSVAAEPQITTQSFVIDLPDPSLPPFFVQLVSLRGSVVITVGTAPTPYALAGDFACAMHVSWLPLPCFRTRLTALRAPVDPGPTELDSSVPERLHLALHVSQVLYAPFSNQTYQKLKPLSTARRYKRQVFLSLDLAAFTTQGRPANNLVLTLEKALLMELDPILKDVK